MFSSFTKRLQDSLEAVENSVAAVANASAQPPATSTNPDRPRTPNASHHAHSSSGDGPSSLAEGALSSIRRSLTLQRAGQAGPSSSTVNGDPLSRTRSPPPAGSDRARELSPAGAPRRAGSTGTGSRLDERLRASLNKTASSPSPSPSRSSTPVASAVEPVIRTPELRTAHSGSISNAPVQTQARATPSSVLPLEPANIPLPPSPQLPPSLLPQSPSPILAPFTPPLTSQTTIDAPSDPLTPNLTAFDIPRISSQAHSHGRKDSFTSSSVLSPRPHRQTHVPPQSMPSSSPLLPSFLPSVAASHAEHVPKVPETPVVPELDARTVEADDKLETNVALATESEPVVQTADAPLPLPLEVISPLPLEEPLAGSIQSLELPPSSVSPIPSSSETDLTPIVQNEASSGAVTADPERQKLLDRLSLVEQRFSDMSGAFKRLQSERAAAQNVLQEHTPLQSLADTEALRTYLVSVAATATKTGDEIKQLTAQIRRQEERMQELRDIHHLEGVSRTQQADRLQAERAEAEALLKAAQEQSAASALDVTRLQSELEKALKSAKEEEEKRVKAISLLKNVRAKGVKTEKDFEEAVKERDAAREEVLKEREAIKAKEEELDKVRKDAVAQIARMRAQGEADREALRVKLEREAAGKQSSYEAETANVKSSHAEELSARTARISELESALKSITEERDSLFDQIQLRQAEVESSHSHLESLEIQVNELNHLLRESNDRASTLAEELAESQRHMIDSSRLSPSPSGQRDALQAIAATAEVERRYEGKLADLRARMASLEKERTESEEEWSRNLALRSREVERLRVELAAKDGQQSAQMDKSARASQERERLADELKKAADDRQALTREIAAMKVSLGLTKDAENEARAEQSQVSQKFSALEVQISELRSREGQLRSTNKTLRDELKKVQSSAALLERQRNPGVGYWAQGSQSRSNVAESPTTENGRGSPRPASPAPSVMSDGAGSVNGVKNPAEEVNLEYLRNIILQFLEHKEMRADLVRVMSVILRFTPAETRRLVSRV